MVGSMAGPFLDAAIESTDALVDLIDVTQAQLKIAMFAAGIPNIAELQNTPYLIASR